MAAPYSLILRKAEKAGLSLVTAAQLGKPFYAGKSSVDKAAPCGIIYAERSTEETPYTGNSNVTLHIMTKWPLGVDTDGIDPTVASDTFSATTFDTFILGHPGDDTALAQALNAQGVADFTAFSTRKISEEASAEGDCWVETLTLDLYCSPFSGGF
jgi:hypothetical protein